MRNVQNEFPAQEGNEEVLAKLQKIQMMLGEVVDLLGDGKEQTPDEEGVDENVGAKTSLLARVK